MWWTVKLMSLRSYLCCQLILFIQNLLFQFPRSLHESSTVCFQFTPSHLGVCTRHCGILQLAYFAYLMGDPYWGSSDGPPQQGLANYLPPSTTAEELRSWETHWKRFLIVFSLNVSWEKLHCCIQKKGEFPILSISNLLRCSQNLLAWIQRQIKIIL